MSNKLHRFYLAVCGTSASVYFRPTHEWLESLDLEDEKKAKKRILELINMSQEDFYKLAIVDKKARVKTEKHGEFEVSKDQEDWFEKAWLITTLNLFKRLGIKKRIPEEEVNVELIRELQKPESKGSWGVSNVTKENDTELKKTIKKLSRKSEESEESPEDKKPVKKLKSLKKAIRTPEEETVKTVENKKLPTKKPKRTLSRIR